MELDSCAERLISIPPADNVGIIEPTIRLNGIDTMRQTGCWPKFTETIIEQSQVQNFRLNHYPVEDFYKSQWQSGDRSFWFLLYRWCIAGFYLAAGLATAITFFDNARFFIFLTDWGFILCMIATTYGAVLSTLWHFDRVDAVEQGWSVKIFWMLHWSALVLATVITLMFWTLLLPVDTVEQGWGYKIFWMLHWSALVLSTVITLMFWTLLLPADPSIAGNPYNILQHAANSFVMLIDHFVVAFPSRILHFVYPLAIGIVYLLFSLVYYFCGGTGANGVSFIYPILDWGESPLIACLSVVIAVICCFIFSFILFWLYKLRVYLCEKFANTQKPHTIHY